jgi:hypothetical protein
MLYLLSAQAARHDIVPGSIVQFLTLPGNSARALPPPRSSLLLRLRHQIALELFRRTEDSKHAILGGRDQRLTSAERSHTEAISGSRPCDHIAHVRIFGTEYVV